MPFFREASSHSATRVTSEACRGKEGGFDYFSVAVENDWHTQVRTSAGSRGSQATPSALRRKLFFGICTNANSRGGYERVRTNEVLQAPQPLSIHSKEAGCTAGESPPSAWRLFGPALTWTCESKYGTITGLPSFDKGFSPL